MRKDLMWKFITVAAVAIACLYSIYANGIKLGLDIKGGFSFLLRMDLERIDSQSRPAAMTQAIEIIGKRTDRYGVAEPIIQQVGTDRILVQIPGLEQKFRDEVRRTLERAAFLEFRLVHERNPALLDQERSDPAFHAPVGFEKLTITQKRDGRTTTDSYFVRQKTELTGKNVKLAFPQFDEIGRPHVAIEFDDEGAQAFARITSANVGRQLAIVLDKQLYSAPVINEAINGGRAEISGNFTLPEAQQLANVLENPLEAPVEIVEERSVDPSLGRDSIRSGVWAGVAGAVAVVVFMTVYYLFAGIVANVAVVLNILILIGALTLFDFTLTLPGIAGIVLTIGMAVDANVLVYERIREELGAGKPLRAAIAAGYNRAFIVIFDSNFTTILTALILIWLGSGPVKGFGVTLTIGLIANMFAAVFVTRWIFEWLSGIGWLKSFNMLHLLNRVPQINFLSVWKITFIVSWVLILAGLASFVSRGGLDVGHGAVYGIDFAGGDTVTMKFAERIDQAQIRTSLQKAGLNDSYIQYQRNPTGGDEVLSLKLPEGTAEGAVTSLQRDFSQADFKVVGSERVGAVIGREMLIQALWAIAASMVAIMIYVAIRFGEFAYGLGAIISLVHDILMTIGIFCLFGLSFSMPVVAAVLTLIGYSINDTIVVFDRIRENKKLTGGKLNYTDLINRSINETLSRTILTGGSVFLCALSLYVFGGPVLNDFAFCFVIGILTGTYSSIYIASPVVLWFHRKEAARARVVAQKTAVAKA